MMRVPGQGLIACLLFSICLLQGCGYRLGTSLPEGIRTIHVKPFVNRSKEPDVENRVTQAAISEFIRDGSLRVVDATSADVVLQGVITEYTLFPLEYDEETATTPEEYRLRLTTEIKLERRSTGKTMLESRESGEADFFTRGDLTTAKREALPEASRDLAHDIVEAVVEYW
jgi:hypothetical protein